MARSLTITQEDQATTSPLFTGFFLIAAGWLALSAFTGFDADAGEAEPIRVELAP